MDLQSPRESVYKCKFDSACPGRIKMRGYAPTFWSKVRLLRNSLALETCSMKPPPLLLHAADGYLFIQYESLLTFLILEFLSKKTTFYYSGLYLFPTSQAACSAPKGDTNVHFWGYFVVETAGIACRVPLCPATTWGLGSGVVGTNQPSLQGTATY